MTKQVIIITQGRYRPDPDIVSCLQSANIAVASLSLTDLKAISNQRWLAVLCQIETEQPLAELCAITAGVNAALPGVPIIACAHDESRGLTLSALADSDFKSIGFRAVVQSFAQLPALLRLIEDTPGTGELKPLPNFDSRPKAVALSLPRAARDKQTRAAFILTASLHLAKNQNEAGEVALDGLSQIVKADSWSIFLAARGRRPDAIALRRFVNRLAPRAGRVSRPRRDNESSVVPISGEPSGLANAAAARIEKSMSNEVAPFMLALPLVSEDIVVGILELVRAGRAFSGNEIALLERLTIPVAAALQNSARISDAERLSHTDDLTQLHNARYMRQFLVNETKRARRYNSNLATVFLDLDDFKQVNDLHGHLVGSHVLMEVASLILPSVRDTDCVVRYGGDEFVIILPETAIDEAIRVAERIRAKLEGHPFSGGRRLKLSLTASFGIAVFPQHASSPQQLIEAADRAMYESKAAGKNRVRASSGIRIDHRASDAAQVASQALKIPGEKLIS
jgi:diguanylate cyclase (GGDEF)-like protein